MTRWWRDSLRCTSETCSEVGPSEAAYWPQRLTVSNLVQRFLVGRNPGPADPLWVVVLGLGPQLGILLARLGGLNPLGRTVQN